MGSHLAGIDTGAFIARFGRMGFWEGEGKWAGEALNWFVIKGLSFLGFLGFLKQLKF